MRSLIVALCALTLLAATTACEGSAPSVSARAESPAPLDYIVRLTGGAQDSEALPMVLVLHGRGDRPANFTKRLEGFGERARFIYLEAPVDEGKGRGWFTFDRGPGGWKRTSDKVKTLGERVVVTLNRLEEKYRTVGKPVITGFSQGSMVLFAAILSHPDRFSFALPVSGALFESILPENLQAIAPALPPVIAFHGDEDPIIP
ncbi:MAG: hypothetical protein AAFQ82_27540, partial [Myxococcota bacterium]